MIVLGGCQATPEPEYDARQPLPRVKPRVVSSNNDRMAPSSGAVDPLKAHMRARRRVNPNDRSAKRSYTKLAGAEPVRRAASSRSNVVIKTPPIPGRKPGAIVTTVAAVNRAAPVSSSLRPVPGYKPQKGELKKAQPRAMSYNITRMRVGDHPGKTRIVFDASAPIVTGVEMANGGRVVYLTFDNTDWQAQSIRSFVSHPVLSGSEARVSNNGTILKIQMKKPVRVLPLKRYPPNGQYNNHRIAIDIIS